MKERSATTADRPSGGGTQSEAVDAATTLERSATPAGSDGGAAGDAKPAPSTARTFLDWVVVVVAAMLIAVVIRTFVMAHFRVEGNSMLNTLHPGDRVFVNKLSYRFGEPGRGDVVVLHELQGHRDLIKRVIALPGETVRIEDCVVYVDEVVLPEPYLSDAVRSDLSWCDFDPVSVPPESVFVMGDNRPASADSRYFGPIPESDIVGHAFVVFWPLADASGL